MKSYTTNWKPLLAVLFVALNPHLLAQDAVSSEQVKTPAVAANDNNAAAWNQRIDELNYSEMPLEEVVWHLRETFPNVNLVVSGDPEGHEVNLQLRNVNLSDICEAMNIALGNEVRFEQQNERLIAVYCREQRSRGNEAEVRAFNLAKYLNIPGLKNSEELVKARDERIQELHEVLRQSWEILRHVNADSKEHRFPQINFHSKTKLLVAVGKPEELEVVERIVSALTDPDQSPSQRIVTDLMDPAPSN